MDSVLADWIWPEWPAPEHVRVCTTTRKGGVSLPPCDSFNLASHVQDDPHAVEENRQRLSTWLALPAAPLWLNQVHGTGICNAAHGVPGADADGAFLQLRDRAAAVCAVLTADCLPVVFTDLRGEQLAVVHAGWRGLAAGVMEAALEKFAAPADEIMAWLGPAIGPQAFEVGGEVREQFVGQQVAAEAAFSLAHRPGHWLADIYALARVRLAAYGLLQVYGGGWCTFSDAERFYSYRRDGACGRMATLAWFAPER